MFEDIETHKKLSKWIIGTFTACILIYLGHRHISHVADAVMWLKDPAEPTFNWIDFGVVSECSVGGY